MFEPPRCPYPACVEHASPEGRFWTRHGSYRPLCRAHPVPRFRCGSCGRTFSRQTFRADYRDHKPHVNAAVAELLGSGIGFRQTARIVGLSPRCTELKFRKLARQAGHLDGNLRRALPRAAVDEDGRVGPGAPLRLHFDEFETFEGRRNTRPLTIAVAIESETRFLVAARAAPIRPRGKMTEARRRAIEQDRMVHGERPNRSRAAVSWAFRRCAELAPPRPLVVLRTDEKSTYSSLAERAFRGGRLEHFRTPSVQPRDARNPLFPINHTEACLRDLVGRVRRESWLVSKARWFLNLHLSLYSAWRNWVRPRFNHDSKSPGQLLGLVDRLLRPLELLGWRQDWGARSPHPCGDGRRSIGGDAANAPRPPAPEWPAFDPIEDGIEGMALMRFKSA